jgi:hypothetical protein
MRFTLDGAVNDDPNDFADNAISLYSDELWKEKIMVYKIVQQCYLKVF